MQFLCHTKGFSFHLAIKHFTFNVARSKWAQFMAADTKIQRYAAESGLDAGKVRGRQKFELFF